MGLQVMDWASFFHGFEVGLLAGGFFAIWCVKRELARRMRLLFG